VTALLDQPNNTRTFENIDGLLTVTSLFKSRSTTQEVKLKVVEFLYFYLMSETPPSPSSTGKSSNPALHQRSPSKLASSSLQSFGSGSSDGGTVIRSTGDKQRLLANYLHNVEDLVQDLRENTPFGGPVY